VVSRTLNLLYRRCELQLKADQPMAEPGNIYIKKLNFSVNGFSNAAIQPKVNRRKSLKNNHLCSIGIE
jgi:hypothetical protein